MASMQAMMAAMVEKFNKDAEERKLERARDIERENERAREAEIREKNLLTHIQNASQQQLKAQQLAEKKLTEHVLSLKQEFEKMQSTHTKQIQECQSKIVELNEITVEHRTNKRNQSKNLISTDARGGHLILTSHIYTKILTRKHNKISSKGRVMKTP
jgi:hypothetical protein